MRQKRFLSWLLTLCLLLGMFSFPAYAEGNTTTISGDGTAEKTGTMTVTLVIPKKTPAATDLTYTAPTDLTYSGSDKAATVAAASGVTGLGDITVKYYSDAARTTEATPKNVGTYYVGATVAEGDQYSASASVLYDNSWTFTINASTPSAPAAPTKASATKNSITLNAVSGCEYSKDGTNWQSGTEFTGLTPGMEYTFYQRVKATTNTNASAASSASFSTEADTYAMTITLVIKPAQTITADDVTATYGDTDKSVSATVTDPATGGGDISYAVKEGSGDYIDVDATTGALTIKKVPADGKAYVTVTAAETATYAQTTKDVTVTISKANAVPATVTANNRTHDGTEKPLVTVTGEATGGAMRYALGTDATTAPASGWSASVPTATDVGTYYVWYKVQGDDDHFDSDAAVVTVTVTKIIVSFEENGGSEVDDQIVSKGGKANRPADPIRVGYDFVDWYADEGCTEVFDFETVIEADITIYALWKPVMFPETLNLAQNYLLLLPDDTFQLEVIDTPRAWLAGIAWSSDNEAVATVDDKGKVTAVSEGVAWITATLDMESSALTALCRIDVTDEYPEVTAVRLVDTKATAELYSTDYTRIEVLPELLQNHTADGHAAADKNLPAIAGTTAIESARFADAATAAAFDLRVVDDRTLEIVPKDEFVQGDEAKLKTLKPRYKSAVIVKIDGQEFTTPQVLQLSVKKTKPRITAKIKAFNSFIPGDTQAFVFSGGVPETVVVESAPAWLSVDTDALTAAYMGAVDLKLKDKVILNVKPKGWAFTTQVTVNVSVAKTAPKLSLSPSTVRLNPGVDALASANAVLGNADPALQQIAVLNVMEGKTNVVDALDVTIDGSSITVRPGTAAPTDGKSHTYKVTLALLRNGMPTDVTSTLTVRLLEESREVSVTAKATGAIDPAIPESPVTVTLTAKNANAASVNVTEVTVAAAAGTAAPQDVTDRFDVEVNGLTVTFRQAGGAALDTSLTYTATIRTNVGAAATVKLTVKTNANPKPTVTLKAAGAIDVIRPDSAVTVTAKVKDCFTYAPALEDLRIWKVTKVNGKTAYEPADDKFDVRMENGAYVLTLKPGANVDHTKDKFAVSLSGALDGTPFETAKTDITVNMGSATIKQSTKSVTLLKDDRNSRASVTITVATAGVNGIDWDKTLASIVIPVDKNNQPLFEVERVGQDIVIRFGNSELKEFKSAKVKVSVFLLGNNSTKPNKTLSISVKLG